MKNMKYKFLEIWYNKKACVIVGAIGSFFILHFYSPYKEVKDYG